MRVFIVLVVLVVVLVVKEGKQTQLLPQPTKVELVWKFEVELDNKTTFLRHHQIYCLVDNLIKGLQVPGENSQELLMTAL